MFRNFGVTFSALLALAGADPAQSESIADTQVTFPDYLQHQCTTMPDATTVVFCINRDDTYQSIGKTPTVADEALLKTILSIFPRRMRERVVEIEFYVADFSEGVGAVYPVDSANSRWAMFINTHPDITDDMERMATIVHELKHYLTLNSTQESADTTICGNIIEMLGTCPTRNSVYADYIKEFWSPIFDRKIWPMGDYNRYYDTHPDDFVTPYAVTDAGEDIAESFSEFIFTNKPTDVSLLKNQKVAYFWRFPEFVALRTEIRDNLDLR